MKRNLLVSLGAAALPALLLGFILLAAPREDAPAAPAPEKTAELPPDPDRPARIRAMREVLDRICAEEDRMAARVRRVLDAPEPTSRGKIRMLSELAHRSGRAGLAEAGEMLDAAHSIPAGPLRIALYSGVLQARVDEDPAGTLKLCGVLHEADDRHAARQFVVRHWAAADFPAAARAIGRLDFPEERFHAARGLLDAADASPAELARILADKDISTELAVPLALVHGELWAGDFAELCRTVPSSSRPPVIDALAAGHALRSPLAVLPDLRAEPDRRLGGTILSAMAAILAAGDAAAALEEILAGGDFAERRDLVQAAFSLWIARAPAAARDWLAARPAGDAPLHAEMQRLLADPAARRAALRRAERE